MKRFIIISLLVAAATPLFACIGIETHNHYLFRVYDMTEFRDRVDRITRDNWKAYLGLDSTEYFWFDAKEVAEAARAKGDELMVSYVNHLSTYLDCASDVISEHWDYPSKEDLQARSNKLLVVRQYALGKVKTRLRSQHALLYMRCNMILGRHSENVQFWEQTASKFINSVYRDMMMNIYAGALVKTGRADEGGEIFMQQGDYQSLMTIYYKRRSFDAIRQVYERNPNHSALPFLLQDFVNNAQEAYDSEHDKEWPGKLFIRNIQRDEAMKMAAFAWQVVCDGKSEVPAMWAAAAAWLNYMFGDKKDAVRYAETARFAQGTEMMKDCARVLQIYIRSAVEAPTLSLDNALAADLQWLTEKSEEGISDDKPYYEHNYFYFNARDRIVHQVLADKYQAQGRTSTALALYYLAGSYTYDYALDTMAVEHLLEYYAYAKSRTTNNKLDDFLKKKLETNDDELINLIGTKYLRLAQWEESIKWLDKVPVEFYNTKGYAVYATFRTPDVEPWIKRQWLDEDHEVPFDQIRLSANPRKAVAQEIMQLEKGLNLLKGEARLQRCYDLAVRYAQIHITGDCWYVLHDAKSTYYDPTEPAEPNEVDFAAKAVQMLRQTANSTDFKLKERALFALSYIYLNPDCWHDTRWNSETADDDWIAVPDRQQYRNFEALLKHERTNPTQTSLYVSRCDEYRQFKKHYHK